MNYQYRFGTSFNDATQKLHEDGGFSRFYHGLTAALLQGIFAVMLLVLNVIALRKLILC
jgi:hypothetical protein